MCHSHQQMRGCVQPHAMAAVCCTAGPTASKVPLGDHFQSHTNTSIIKPNGTLPLSQASRKQPKGENILDSYVTSTYTVSKEITYMESNAIAHFRMTGMIGF